MATSTTAEALYAFAFTFDSIINYTEFTSLYDSYRIDSIRLTLIPAYTIAQTGVSTNLGGYMVAVCDYDDATTTSIANLLQCSNKRIYGLTRQVTMVLPELRTKVGASGATGGNMVSARSSWFDLADTAQPFYGLKIAFTQTTIVQTYNAIFDYYVSLRGDR